MSQALAGGIKLYNFIKMRSHFSGNYWYSTIRECNLGSSAYGRSTRGGGRSTDERNTWFGQLPTTRNNDISAVVTFSGVLSYSLDK